MFQMPSLRSILASKLIALSCAYILVLANTNFWLKVFGTYQLTTINFAFIISLIFTLFCLHYLLLIAFCIQKIFKPFLIILLLVTALGAYAMDNFGYVMAAQAFQSMFETNYNEVLDLLGTKLALYIIFLWFVPALYIYKVEIKFPSNKHKLIYSMVLLVAIAFNLAIFNKQYIIFFRNNKQVHYYLNPARSIYSLAKYFARHVVTGEARRFSILDDSPHIIKTKSKPKLVVLVVGESDRASNYSINGYQKPTNPKLSLRDDLYSFSQFYACGTETAVSIPCMFSSFARQDYNYANGRYTENVLDLLTKSDVKVIWRDNDNGCKHVCDRVESEDFSNASVKPYCNSFECFDEILLHNIQDLIDRDIKDKLIVLHKKGNHGPAYFKRYPSNFEKFLPSCKSNELQNCKNDEITNAYDNAILYTDHFLDELIGILEKNQSTYQTAMLYVSDHGESLGENGVYLHAMPYNLAPKEQLHIPFMIWASDDFGLDKSMISALSHKYHSHDNLFHSLLGLFQVNTRVYSRNLDIFSPLGKH